MLTRRTFLARVAGLAGCSNSLFSEQPAVAVVGAGTSIPRFTCTTIFGSPRERGKSYGERGKDAIGSFLEKVIYHAFVGQPSPKDALLRYAGACAEAVQAYSPIIHAEFEGMAEGSGRRVEELILITLHEELYHKGSLPSLPHCTAAAAGPPVTTGDTFVGQTWDWMTSVAGKSSLVHWKRPEGPSLLAYGYPGMWAGAGLNSAGLALCWTSAALEDANAGVVRVGIPSYILLTHLLYQESLEAVIEEAQRATPAGWFTFVMADGNGNLLNVEGSPKGVAIERHRGRLARVGFGSRQMTGTTADKEVQHSGRCGKMYELLDAAAGRIDHRSFQHWYEEPKYKIAEPDTLDLMVFNTTARKAYLSRGASYGVEWQEFGFDEVDGSPAQSGK